MKVAWSDPPARPAKISPSKAENSTSTPEVTKPRRIDHHQQARYLTELEWRACHAVNIYVYRNGVQNQSPILIHVPPEKRSDMKTILHVLSQRIKYPIGYAKALYKMDGTRIMHPCQLEMYNNYVVASNQDKHFRLVQYGRRRSPLLILSPVSKHARAIGATREASTRNFLPRWSSNEGLNYICPKSSLEEINQCCNATRLGIKTVKQGCSDINRNPTPACLASSKSNNNNLPTNVNFDVNVQCLDDNKTQAIIQTADNLYQADFNHQPMEDTVNNNRNNDVRRTVSNSNAKNRLMASLRPFLAEPREDQLQLEAQPNDLFYSTVLPPNDSTDTIPDSLPNPRYSDSDFEDDDDQGGLADGEWTLCHSSTDEGKDEHGVDFILSQNSPTPRFKSPRGRTYTIRFHSRNLSDDALVLPQIPSLQSINQYDNSLITNDEYQLRGTRSKHLLNSESQTDGFFSRRSSEIGLLDQESITSLTGMEPLSYLPKMQLPPPPSVHLPVSSKFRQLPPIELPKVSSEGFVIEDSEGSDIDSGKSPKLLQFPFANNNWTEQNIFTCSTKNSRTLIRSRGFKFNSEDEANGNSGFRLGYNTDHHQFGSMGQRKFIKQEPPQRNPFVQDLLQRPPPSVMSQNLSNAKSRMTVQSARTKTSRTIAYTIPPPTAFQADEDSETDERHFVSFNVERNRFYPPPSPFGPSNNAHSDSSNSNLSSKTTNFGGLLRRPTQARSPVTFNLPAVTAASPDRLSYPVEDFVFRKGRKAPLGHVPFHTRRKSLNPKSKIPTRR